MRSRVILLAAILAAMFAIVPTNASAVASPEISPVSNSITLVPGTQIDYDFQIRNTDEEAPATYEIYAAPYSYIYSEQDDEYQLGFSTETSYTQISRWIAFKNDTDEYVERMTVTLAAGEKHSIDYRINVPASIPNGGQYAVIFTQTVNDAQTDAITTTARAGLVIFAHGDGETTASGEILESNFANGLLNSGKIAGSAKVRNTGNTDIQASTTLTIRNIFGGTYYDNTKNVSTIPETDFKLTDEWEGTPFFGLFNVAWTVKIADQVIEESKIILVMPTTIIVFILCLLTIIVIWVTLIIKKRKERHTRRTI